MRSNRVLRDRLWEDQRGRCYYCRRGVRKAEATLDHRCPASRGGEVSYVNGVMACLSCNQAKADLPESAFIAQRPKSSRKIRKAIPPAEIAKQQAKAERNMLRWRGR